MAGSRYTNSSAFVVRFVLAALTAFACAGSVCTGSFREVEPGVFVEDFEDGSLAGWRFKEPLSGEIVEVDGNSVLTVKSSRKVGKGSVVQMPVPAMEDFVVQARFRNHSGAGIHFRKGYKVFFLGGGDMWMRRPGAMLVRWVRGWNGRDDYKRADAHEIRACAVGRIVRVYVDDRMELEMLDYSPGAHPFWVRHRGAQFDDIRVSAHVPPEEGLIAFPVDAGQDFWEEGSYRKALRRGQVSGPRVKDGAMWFAASKPVRPEIQVLNESDTAADVEVRVAVDRFDDSPVGEPKTKTVRAAPGSRQVLTFELGRLAPGFYRMRITLSGNGRELRTTPYPLFVDELAAPVDCEKPLIPVGVVLKSVVWKPLHAKTYWHGIGARLRKHNLNAVVATGGCHREFREIFRRHGVFTIVRGKDKAEHPAVLGLLETGKPERVAKLRASVDAPVISPVRLHPFQRGEYDLLRAPDGEPTASEALKAASGGPDPLWVLLQAFGDREPGGQKGRFDNPTPAQLRAQTHLALAYGARGILYYTFQRRGAELGLVDHISLKALDGKLEAVGELAGLIAQHAELLSSLQAGGAAVRCDNPAVEAVPARTDTGRYVYVVNKDTARGASCVLAWPASDDLGLVRDVYADAELVPTRAGGETRLTVALEPGEGRLLALNR